jgi:integrase
MARLQLYLRGKTWWVRGTVDGEPVRESTRHTDKKRAQSWAAKREWELDQASIYGPGSVFTFGAAVNLYIEGGGEQRFLLPLLEEMGHRLAKDIPPGDWVDLANRLYPDASSATKNRQVITPVTAVYRHAAKRGKCSPILIERFEVKRILKRKTATWEWVEKFTGTAKPKLVALALFLATTAARIGDALSLEWGDVDLDAGTALLRDTKNGEDRLVTLLPLVREALKGLPRRVGEKRVFIFYDRSDVLRQIKTACKKAGIEYIPTHGIGRRLFATTMNADGVDAKTASTAGGWKTVRMYQEIYAQHGDEKSAVETAIGTRLAQSVKLKSRKV